MRENQLHLDAPFQCFFLYTDSDPVHGSTTAYSLSQDTVLVEDSELIISKLSLRCMLFVFAIFSIDLWLRGMGLMGSVAYIAAMLIIICTNDNEPNNAAYILLFYDTLAIIAFFRSYNPANHTMEVSYNNVV